jgi:hypothetical protein
MGTSTPRTSAGPIPSLGNIPEVPQPESSGTCSATNSEIDSAMNHRRRKASLRNHVFSSQEFNALSSVDAYLGTVRFGFENTVDVLSKGLQVKIPYYFNSELHIAPVALGMDQCLFLEMKAGHLISRTFLIFPRTFMGGKVCRVWQ